MASHSTPRILTFKADSAISKGMVVKPGSDSQHVAKASAASDKAIGLCQNDPTAAEDAIEVALPGGGAKGLAGGTIAAGDMLTSDSAGKLIATTTNADRCIAMALESAVSGDVFAVEVVAGVI